MMLDMDQMTESKKRELMLEIEELAHLEGLRDYVRTGSEFRISADILNLLDNKADKTEIVRNDGTVSLTGDWDIGDGMAIKADKIVARSQNGLALLGDSETYGIFVKDGGNVEIDGSLVHNGATIGFFGVTPVSKQSSLTSQLTTIICSNPTTPDYDISDPVQGSNAYGFSTADEFKTIMSVITNLQVRLSELEYRLKNYGLLQ